MGRPRRTRVNRENTMNEMVHLRLRRETPGLRLAAVLVTASLSGGAAAAQEIGDAEVVSLPEFAAGDLYTGAISLDRMMDEAELHDATGEEIGGVEDVLFGPDGRVLSIVAEVGGVWDIGDTHVNIPWDRVDYDAAANRATVPLTEDTLEEYSQFPEDALADVTASTQVEAVMDDTEAGPRVWRASEFIGDYARLRGDDGLVDYGYVHDLLVRDGELAAVLVRPDVGWTGPRGVYAYPFYGYGDRWNPGLDTYNMPYGPRDAEVLEPYDYGRMD